MVSRRDLFSISVSFIYLIFFHLQIEVSTDCSTSDLKELLTSIAGLNRCVHACSAPARFLMTEKSSRRLKMQRFPYLKPPLPPFLQAEFFFYIVSFYNTSLCFSCTVSIKFVYCVYGKGRLIHIAFLTQIL